MIYNVSAYKIYGRKGVAIMQLLSFCTQVFLKNKSSWRMLYLVLILSLLTAFVPVFTYGRNFTLKTDYLLMNYNSLFLMLLIYCTPLFIALLYVKIGQDEKQMFYYLKMRTRPIYLHVCNFVFSFIVGFLYMLIFLVLSYLYSYILSAPNVDYIGVSQMLFNFRFPEFIIENLNFGTLYLAEGNTIIFIYMLFFCVYSGIVCMLAYSGTCIFKKKVYAYIYPFVFLIVYQFFIQLFAGKYKLLYIQNLLNPFTSYFPNFLTIMGINYMILTFICILTPVIFNRLEKIRN